MAHAIKALLTYYDVAFTKKFGNRAPILAKDAALAKRLLGLYTSRAVGTSQSPPLFGMFRYVTGFADRLKIRWG